MGQKITAVKRNTPKVEGWSNPQIFDLKIESQAAALTKLYDQNKILHISDNIKEAVEELYHIDNPTEIDSVSESGYKEYIESLGELDKFGIWVFFPWNGTLVHFPSSDDLSRLRGSRNRNLITDEERKELIRNKTILVLGLSVGSNVIDSLLLQGIGSKYILVDMDTLSPTNLNRIRASYDQVGIHKVDLVAKKISELNPFISQVHYKNGLSEENLEEILIKHKPDIIVDEMDSLHMKLVVRKRARDVSIPVLMATDDGDDILLDIERFDLKKDQPILHGILPDEIVEQVLANKNISRRETGAIIGKYFVNLENVPVRMIESLMEVGKSLPSWPQLGSAAVLSGLYVAYATRKILLGQNINSGRFLMGPEEQLNPDIKSTEYKEKKDILVRRMTI